MTPETKALLDLYGRNADAAADVAWYDDAKELARLRAAAAGIDYTTYAAVVAATSPANRWDAPIKGTWPNLDSADRAIRHWRGTSDGEPYPGMLGASLAKALRILDGADPTFVLGPKTRAFWHALQGDLDHVVLDRWALRAIGAPDSTPQNPVRYAALADHYRQAAAAAGISPAQLQAATWTQIRREWSTR